MTRHRAALITRNASPARQRAQCCRHTAKPNPATGYSRRYRWAATALAALVLVDICSLATVTVNAACPEGTTRSNLTLEALGWATSTATARHAVGDTVDMDAQVRASVAASSSPSSSSSSSTANPSGQASSSQSAANARTSAITIGPPAFEGSIVVMSNAQGQLEVFVRTAGAGSNFKYVQTLSCDSPHCSDPTALADPIFVTSDSASAAPTPVSLNVSSTAATATTFAPRSTPTSPDDLPAFDSSANAQRRRRRSKSQRRSLVSETGSNTLNDSGADSDYASTVATPGAKQDQPSSSQLPAHSYSNSNSNSQDNDSDANDNDFLEEEYEEYGGFVANVADRDPSHGSVDDGNDDGADDQEAAKTHIFNFNGNDTNTISGKGAIDSKPADDVAGRGSLGSQGDDDLNSDDADVDVDVDGDGIGDGGNIRGGSAGDVVPEEDTRCETRRSSVLSHRDLWVRSSSDPTVAFFSWNASASRYTFVQAVYLGGLQPQNHFADFVSDTAASELYMAVGAATAGERMTGLVGLYAQLSTTWRFVAFIHPLEDSFDYQQFGLALAVTTDRLFVASLEEASPNQPCNVSRLYHFSLSTTALGETSAIQRERLSIPGIIQALAATDRFLTVLTDLNECYLYGITNELLFSVTLEPLLPSHLHHVQLSNTHLAVVQSAAESTQLLVGTLFALPELASAGSALISDAKGYLRAPGYATFALGPYSLLAPALMPNSNVDPIYELCLTTCWETDDEEDGTDGEEDGSDWEDSSTARPTIPSPTSTVQGTQGSSFFHDTGVVILGAAVTLAVLILGAVALSLSLRRRRLHGFEYSDTGEEDDELYFFTKVGSDQDVNSDLPSTAPAPPPHHSVHHQPGNAWETSLDGGSFDPWENASGRFDSGPSEAHDDDAVAGAQSAPEKLPPTKRHTAMEKLVFNQAVSNGDIQRVAKLVNGDRTLLWEYLDSSGQTCFIRAILMAQREMLQALLEMAAEYAELCLSREDVTGKNAMHWAICVSDEEVVELLANVSPHLLVSKTSTNGDTVLHLLGREDNIEMLRFTSKLRSGLVEMRIMDINDSNKTPHEVAQDAGAVDTPAALLELFRKTIRPKETSLDARKRMQRTLAQRLYRVRFNKKTTGPGATSPDSVNGVSPDLKLDRLGVASSSSWAPAPGTLGLDSAQQYVSGKQAQYDFCDPFLSNPMEPEHLVLDEHLLDSATMAFEPSSSLRAGVLFSDEQLTAASHA